MAPVSKPLKDLSGQQINNWSIIKYAGKGKWLCECTCGRTTKEILTSVLTSGRSKMCRLCADDNQRSVDYNMIGLKVGAYQVIRYIGGGSYLCRCSCNNERIIKGFNLREALKNNHNLMCDECYYKDKLDDITGQRFGNWFVLNYIGDGYYLCECQCENGTLKKVHGKSLKSGASTSCGCNSGNKMMLSKYNKYKEICSNKIDCPRSDNQILASTSQQSLHDFILEQFGDASPTIKELSLKLGIGECMTLRKVHKYNLEYMVNINDYSSNYEKEILSIVEQLTQEKIIHKDRSVITPYELDIYIPEKKIAIEFNGDYWHSDIYKDKKYHQQKTIACAKKGIQLIHIFEHEWLNIKEKIVDILGNKLADNKTLVYGRNTFVKVVNRNDAEAFLNKYHLQGYTNSEINIGIYLNDALLSLMTFGKPRFNTNYQYEIIRYAVKNGINIIGGAEKIFKYFLSNFKPDSIISYVDISKFTGNIYTKLGFIVESITEPNYVWVNPEFNKVLARYNTMKHKLIENGLGNKDQTEDEIMRDLGFYKIYNSGNLKMCWKALH